MKNSLLVLCLAVGGLAATLPSCSKELTEQKTVEIGILPGDKLAPFTAQVYSAPDGAPAAYDFAKTSGTRVLVVNSTMCPYCKQSMYGERMRQIEETYTARGVTFLHLYPDGREVLDRTPDLDKKRTPIREHHAALGFKAPFVHDEGGVITKAIAGSKTPEYVVVNAAGVITYRGGLDDSSGKWKDAKAQFLVPALDATLDGKPVAVPKTTPVG
jgi:hypothetical protein